MEVQKQISEDGKVLTIILSGRFDITSHRSFSDAYKDKADSVSKFIVDMTDAEYLDSSALGMLLMLREHAGGEDADICVINMTPGVKKIFQTANFDKLFKTE